MNMPSKQAASCRRATQILLPILFFMIPLSIAVIEILFPFLLITWFLGWVASEEQPRSAWRSRIGGTVFFSLLLYVAICALSIRFSSYPILSVRGLVKKLFQFSLFCLIAADAAQDPHVARRCMKALLASAGLVVLYGLLQQLTILIFQGVQGAAMDPIRGRPLSYDRMMGPYKNPNDLATFLMVVLLMLIPQLLRPPARLKISLWILGISMMACIAWTEAKGAILGLAVGLVFLFFQSGTRNKKLFSTLAGVFAATIVFFIIKENHLWKALTLSDIGSQDRAVMWRTAWRMIRARPILGHGLNTFMANYMAYVAGPTQGPAYAHNCFLQITAETGLLGLTAFLWFLWKLFSSGWRTLKTASKHAGDYEPLLAGVMAGLLAFLVQSAFDTNLYSLRQAVLFWSLSGYAVGLSVSAAQRPES